MKLTNRRINEAIALLSRHQDAILPPDYSMKMAGNFGELERIQKIYAGEQQKLVDQFPTKPQTNQGMLGFHFTNAEDHVKYNDLLEQLLETEIEVNISVIPADGVGQQLPWGVFKKADFMFSGLTEANGDLAYDDLHAFHCEATEVLGEWMGFDLKMQGVVPVRSKTKKLLKRYATAPASNGAKK